MMIPLLKNELEETLTFHKAHMCRWLTNNHMALDIAHRQFQSVSESTRTKSQKKKPLYNVQSFLHTTETMNAVGGK